MRLEFFAASNSHWLIRNNEGLVQTTIKQDSALWKAMLKLSRFYNQHQEG